MLRVTGGTQRQWILIWLCCFLCSLSAQAQDPARLALLIGNQGYATKVGALRNPHNDITLIDASLKKLPMASLTRNRCR